MGILFAKNVKMKYKIEKNMATRRDVLARMILLIIGVVTDLVAIIWGVATLVSGVYFNFIYIGLIVFVGVVLRIIATRLVYSVALTFNGHTFLVEHVYSSRRVVVEQHDLPLKNGDVLQKYGEYFDDYMLALLDKESEIG